MDEALRRKLRDAALRYADRGWAVFPLEVGGKRPLPGTRGHKDATRDADEIRRLWAEEPYNIGLACDDRDGPIVLDVDGPAGARALKKLGIDPDDAPRAVSGRPHRLHLYFAPPARLPQGGVRRTIRVFPDLDVLGLGGYVVAPPSIHPETGRPYRWERSGENALLPPLPASVLKALKRHRGERKDASGHARPLPDQLVEGQRDDALTSLAGSMRRRGASESAILAALREENATRCVPPLPDASLRKIARSIGQKAPVVRAPHQLTELGNAELFVQLYGERVRWCQPLKSWLAWDGARWAPNAVLSVEMLSEEVAHELRRTEERELDADAKKALRKHWQETTKYRNRKAFLESVKNRLSIRPGELDADPWVFNLANGTLDLRTAALKPHRREDLLTRLAPVTFDPRAECPLWYGFLTQVTGDDADLQRFLQRAVGYSLAGVTHEHALFFCHGDGATGKSTFLETLLRLVGPDYGIMIDFETLLRHTSARASEAYRDIARLRGARLVMANETPTNARWDERTIKELTGGDVIRARQLYSEAQEFTPTHTLWCRANDQPAVHDASEGFWRRIKLIPFTVRVPPKRRVLNLKEQLAEELPGILNWALEGLQGWRQASAQQDPNPLGVPVAVLKATKTYRQQTDSIGEFIAERCELAADAWSSTADLYRELESWWRESRGERARAPNTYQFSQDLAMRARKLGIARQRRRRPESRGRINGWLGIRLRDE